MFFPQFCHFIKRKGEKTEGVALGNKGAGGVGRVVEERDIGTDFKFLFFFFFFFFFFKKRL